MTNAITQSARKTIGRRIKRVRESKGLSRREVVHHLQVDPTALAAWEAGKYLPRDGNRFELARFFNVDIEFLFDESADIDGRPTNVRLVDTVDELPGALVEMTRQAHSRLRAMRLAAPYTTAAYVQTEWRQLISDRILAGTISVERIEIFYSLQRLKETLSNILRYDGRAYHVKAHCVGIADVVPAMGGYFFDDDEFVLGGYWTGVPPINRPGLRMSGVPFKHFFNAYWEEVWRSGKVLNISGSHDLANVRAFAEQLGLGPRHWSRFVEEARDLVIGDGAPPLI